MASASINACAPISARCRDSSPLVRSLGMRCGIWCRIGPLSRPAVICMMVTPVCSSPRRIAHSTGAAPRSSGSSEGWTLTMPRLGIASSSGVSRCPYATTTPTSGARRRIASRNSDVDGRSGWSTGRSSSCAAVFTGDGTSVERERPCGLSGRVTTEATSKPSPSSASSGGTANSGVPKKTTRTLQLAGRLGRHLLDESLLSLARLLPFGDEEAALYGAEVVEEEDAVEVVDLVLDGAGLVAAHFGAVGAAVPVRRLDHNPLRPFDVAEDFRDREAAFLGDLDFGAALDDHGVDEHQRRRVLLAHVHDGDALRDADLVGGEPHAFGGAHRFEQVVHQPPHRVVHAGDRRRTLAQHRRAEQVEAANGHDALASAARLTMLAMLPRSTTSLASPLRIVTSLSFRCTTSPTMPPEVTIWSPRCSVSSSFLCSSCWRRCGRRMRKYSSPKIRPSWSSSSPIPGPALPDGASSRANRPRTITSFPLECSGAARRRPTARSPRPGSPRASPR